jgi:NAD(P)-dependent dehydrogenase (short-subunit alcohol dehydrogenase family)
MHSFLEQFNFTGRSAVITGGAGKVATDLAVTLAALGCRLHLVDRPGISFHESLHALANEDGRVTFHACDLEDDNSREQLVEHLAKLPEPIDFLINNAAFVGTSDLEGWATAFEKQRIDTWRRAIEVNLTAVFDLCKGLQHKLTASPSASIINVASIYGMVAPDFSIYEGTDMGNPAAYAASKGGLIQLTRWLATAMAPQVRVNCISPGGIYRNQDQDFVDNYVSKTPLGRMATEADITGIVVFLCSGLSRYITGQNIPVDGGWTVW